VKKPSTGSKHLKSIKVDPLCFSQKLVCLLPAPTTTISKKQQQKKQKKTLTVIKNHYVLDAAAGYAKGGPNGSSPL